MELTAKYCFGFTSGMRHNVKEAYSLMHMVIKSISSYALLKQCFAIFSNRQKNRDNPLDHLEIESFKQVFQDQDRLENRERGVRNIEIESESAF